MLQFKGVKRRSDINALVNTKSHTQKKYFSLMLVPSYTTGKTRSIKIPYAIFYFIIISVITISAIILAFYLRANHFRQIAQGYSQSLDLAQEAYLALQENSDITRNQLINNSNQLKDLLTDEQNRFQAEKNNQQQAYQESLNDILKQVEELERQLQELQQAREEVLSQLGAKAYIPPVASLLTDLNKSQDSLLSGVVTLDIRSDERSSAIDTTLESLQDYFQILAAKLQTQLSCFANLQAQIKKIAPYVKNYPTRWPVYGTVTSRYGYRQNPMGGSGNEYHDGIDIKVSTGTAVKATGGGKVVTAGWQSSYGYVVIIDHGYGIQTLYAHNSKLLVAVGQRVERGDTIARSGSTGRSTGPHVHYEVRVNGRSTNPTKYLLEK